MISERDEMDETRDVDEGSVAKEESEDDRLFREHLEREHISGGI